MGSIPINLVVVGDDAVGKTSLLSTYANGEFVPEFITHIYDGDPQDIMVNGTPVKLTLNDVIAPEDYAFLRAHLYSQADAILMCFSLVEPKSYESVRDYWYSEFNYNCPNSPVILIGTKSDLVNDQETITWLRERKHAAPITTVEGLNMGKEINAVKYIECSSLTQKGLEEVFETALSAGLQNKIS